MTSINILSESSAVILTLILSIIFLASGIYYSRKHKGLNNYLIANRNIGVFSLTASFVSSALGAWILFGPASAATWGGIGVVIGYSLGTAFPLFILIYLGEKFRKLFPKAKTLIEVVRLKFGKQLFKLILFLTVFYMAIFLIAEVTAVSILVNYISGTSLWITALIVMTTSLVYTLYGGLRASIFTDSIQFILFVILLIVALGYLISFNSEQFNFEFIKLNKPNLLSFNYLPNFTAGLTFFIAVAATNLFHQGNWQRVYAAKNNYILKKSLLFSFFIIVPIVFFMGFSGLVAISVNSNVSPDLAFFSLLLIEQITMLSVIVVILGISLTISSIDTLINAISSLIIVDGNKIINFKGDYFKLSNYLIIFISIIVFVVASKGLSILYLFLLADLFCCSAVLTLFYSFYKKSIKEKNAYTSILIGLMVGLLLFPSPDFSKSILIGVLFPKSFFPEFVSQSLLFLSFLFATFIPIFAWKIR
jgi:Na+/proline symporter